MYPIRERTTYFAAKLAYLQPIRILFRQNYSLNCLYVTQTFLSVLHAAQTGMSVLRKLYIFLQKKEKKYLTAFCLFYVLVNTLSLGLPFFGGDAIVQSSIAAQWYYDHDFAYFFLPTENNAGHPPFFGMYLALWWKVLGQSLIVSHLSMLPFLLGVASQFFFIVRYFLSEKWQPYALILFVLEPTILAQSTMVTPELPILFLYLLAIRSILYHKVFWQILATCLVVLLNTRGVMIVAVVFLSEVLINRSTVLPVRVSNSTRDTGWKYCATLLIVKYIPAGLVAVAWLFVHYYIEGWIGFNRADMQWKNSFIRVEGIGILKNIAVFGWRLLDFGRVWLWLVVGLALVKFLRESAPHPPPKGEINMVSPPKGELQTSVSSDISKMSNEWAGEKNLKSSGDTIASPPLEGAGGWTSLGNSSDTSKVSDEKGQNWSLIVLIITPIIVFAPVMLPYIGTLQHRYLLPFFAMFVIGVAWCFSFLNNKNNKSKTHSPDTSKVSDEWTDEGNLDVSESPNMADTLQVADEFGLSGRVRLLFWVVVFGLMTGHLWVYPDQISQGWEASLAHLPYFDVRDDMTDYVQEKGINPNEIATGSPNKYRRLDSDLQREGTWKFRDIDEVRYDTFEYIIYSNVFNDFADSTYFDLHSNWVREREYTRMQVRMTLFRNPVGR